MKKLYMILAVSLCSWQAMHGAASSSAVTEPDTDYSIPRFLKRLHVDPNEFRVTPRLYTSEFENYIDAANAKLRHIQNEVTPFITHLFTLQPTSAADKENLFHTFLVGRIAIYTLFSPLHDYSESSFNSSSSSNKTLSQILIDMSEDQIRVEYWKNADEQPGETEYRAESRKNSQNCETISGLRTWFTALKNAQHTGAVSSSEEELHLMLGELFEMRCAQLRTQRDAMQAHIAPGLAALAQLKTTDFAKAAVNEPEQAAPSNSCAHQ